MKQKFPFLKADEYFPFPSVDEATDEGIVAHGGNLSPGMLLSAYTQGIFPWYSDSEPILWWSPDPRFVMFPEKLHVASSMEKILRQQKFLVTLDRDFYGIITNCSRAKRKGQHGTWITSEMIDAYAELHTLGFAHSVEAWLDGELAGGLYGVSLGSIFFGESMFSRSSNASKTAFIRLVWYLRRKGFTVIDSQVYTPHLSRLGAEEIPRDRYLDLLKKGLGNPTFRGNWGLLFSDFSDAVSIPE